MKRFYILTILGILLASGCDQERTANQGYREPIETAVDAKLIEIVTRGRYNHPPYTLTSGEDPRDLFMRTISSDALLIQLLRNEIFISHLEEKGLYSELELEPESTTAALAEALKKRRKIKWVGFNMRYISIKFAGLTEQLEGMLREMLLQSYGSYLTDRRLDSLQKENQDLRIRLEQEWNKSNQSEVSTPLAPASLTP